MRKTFWLPITLALAAYLVLPLPGLSAPLNQRIDKKRDQIAEARQKEGVLSTTIQQFSNRIEVLQGEISATERRLERAQASLDRQQAELEAVRDKLEEARDRLERLRRELDTARRVLAARLVEIYKADSPDALTVVLESDGFGDLLERAEFLERISEQDRNITDRVRDLRDQAHEQAVQLAELEEQEQLAAERILAERDQIAAAQSQLVSSRDELAAARADKRGALATVRDSRVALEGDLRALEAEQARVQAALAAKAAAAGRVVLMGWVGGYGNYTCIQHGGSLSTCYAHQSSFATSNGASVGQGQVIGYVGCTGHCFGDHLHFETRTGGSPVD